MYIVLTKDTFSYKIVIVNYCESPNLQNNFIKNNLRLVIPTKENGDLLTNSHALYLFFVNTLGWNMDHSREKYVIL